MLRLLDGTKTRNWRRAVAKLPAMSLVFVGLGMGMLCGELAASAEEAGVPTTSGSAESSSQVATPSVKFMELASSQVAVVLRPREMAQSLSFGSLVSVAQPFVQEQFELALEPIKNKPPVRFEAIEYIVYSLRPYASRGDVAPESAPEKSAWEDVTFELAIQFAAPTDCVAWAAAELPNAERVESDGLACVRIKMGDSLGEVMYLVQRDPFTAVATSDERRLKQLVKEQSGAKTADLENELFNGNVIACTIDLAPVSPSDWEEVLQFTSAFALFVFREGSYSTSEKPDPVAVAKRAFVDGAQRVTVGIGVTPESEELAWRVLLDCAKQPAAASVRTSVEFFQKVATGIVDAYDRQLEAAVQRGEINGAEDVANAKAIAFTSQLLSDATISPRSIRSADDAILLESSGSLPKLLPALLGVQTETFHPPTAPARADSADSVAD